MENDADAAMAETLLGRLGGALTVEDILLLRAAGAWHRIQWELAAERDGGDAGRRQRAPVVSPEQRRALRAAGMPPKPARLQGLNTVYILDPDPVQPQLDRAEVAAGYLMALHGVPADDQAASYPSTDAEPCLGPMAVIELWDRIDQAQPELQLAEREWLWTRAALDSTEP
jgi:hypothetical protein